MDLAQALWHLNNTKQRQKSDFKRHLFRIKIGNTNPLKKVGINFSKIFTYKISVLLAQQSRSVYRQNDTKFINEKN